MRARRRRRVADPGPNPPFPPRTRTPHPRERRRAGGGRVRALILSVAAALLAVSPAMAQDGTDEAALPAATDRKSVVEGKSVSVRVDLGGRRLIKNKRQINTIYISKLTQ